MQVEFTKEQQEALEKMKEDFAFSMAMSMSLTFMEEKFGSVNLHVIEFRKTRVKEAAEKLNSSQNRFNELGGIDVLLKRLEEKNEG